MLLPSSFVSSVHGLSPSVTISSVALACNVGGRLSMMQTPLAVAGTAKVLKFAVPVALSIAGGGVEGFTGSAKTVMDINRVKMRLEGLQAYGTVCALLMNATLRLNSSTPTNPEKLGRNATKHELWAMDIFTLCVIVSVLFGSYTTIIFSMLAMYSKRALGQGLDSQFLEFFDATDSLRESGFGSFIYSLVSFELAFLLSLFITYTGPRRKKMVGFAFLISSLAAWRWLKVMGLAGKILFT